MPAASGSSGSSRCVRERLGAGQAQAHQRAAAGGRLGGDAAALLVGDLADDRKAQPRAGTPARLGAAVEAVEHVGQVLGGDPGSVVAHRQLLPVQRDLDRLARGLYLIALSIRLLTARCSRAGTPTTTVGSSCTSQRRGRSAPARALDHLADDQVQAHVLGVGARFLAAGEVDQVVHQQRQLLDLLDDVVEQPRALAGVHVLGLLQDLDVRAQAGHRRAQLVGGVGHELALRVHGGVERAHRSLESVEHRVEAVGEPPDLIFADGLDAPAQVLGQRDVLGRLGEALERQHGGAGHEPSEQRRERDAADVEQRQDQAQVRSAGCRLRSAAGRAGRRASAPRAR